MSKPTDRREELCDWLRANGVDPNEVIRDGELYIDTADDGTRTLHCEVLELNENGQRFINERGDGVAVRQVVMSLVVEPPGWWQPCRKPTREQLLEAVGAVLRLHVRNPNCGVCEHCSERDYPNYEVPWPCPTIQALDTVPSIIDQPAVPAPQEA